MRFLSFESVRKIYIIRTFNGFGAVFSVVGGSDGSFLHFFIVENIPENRMDSDSEGSRTAAPAALLSPGDNF